MQRNTKSNFHRMIHLRFDRPRLPRACTQAPSTPRQKKVAQTLWVPSHRSIDLFNQGAQRVGRGSQVYTRNPRFLLIPKAVHFFVEPSACVVAQALVLACSSRHVCCSRRLRFNLLHLLQKRLAFKTCSRYLWTATREK